MQMRNAIALGSALALAFVMNAGTALGEDAKPTYIGSAKCKMCHISQHKTWTASAHSTAFARLTPEDAKKADCLACHTTGFVAATAAYNEEGIGCESCHGPGSVYAAKDVMNKEKFKADPEGMRKIWKAGGLVTPVEATCKGCHNEKSPNYKPFDFAKASAAIKHWKDKAAAPPAAK